MILDCFFDLLACCGDFCLNRISFDILAFRIIAGFFINVTAFAITTGLNNGVEGRWNLAFFLAIIVFIVIQISYVCLLVFIRIKAKHSFHVESMVQSYKDCVVKIAIEEVEQYIKIELILVYKQFEMLFDVFLFLYGFQLTNWSPDKDPLCLVAVIASGIDFILNFTFSSIYAIKLISWIGGDKCICNEKSLRILGKILLRTTFYFIFLLKNKCCENGKYYFF